MTPKISVIIPMYKVGAFIEKCATTLMNQTLESKEPGSVEYLFVDDCSPDDSRSKLEKVLAAYPDRNARILTHEQNKGLPAARNTGIAQAQGEYIFHCDGDDWVETDMLEQLWNAATRDGGRIDYLWCDFFISFEHNERYMAARDYKTPQELVRRGFLCGAMKFNVWNKMVRRQVYARVEPSMTIFPSGHPMAEDMTMILLAARSESVAYVPKALYHYVRTNAGAMTQVMSRRQLDDIQHNVARVCEYLPSVAPGEYDRDLAIFKLAVKIPFLLSGDPKQYELWKQWYPESNGYAFANRELPFRTRLLQWMAAKDQWWYVNLYYSLVFKFIYGKLYK